MEKREPENTGKQETSIMDLILAFLAFAREREIKNFPALESQFWHTFLYELKKNYSGQFPLLRCVGEFDWNGTFPKCRNFIDAEFGLGYSCLIITGTNRFMPVPLLRKREISQESPELFEIALKLAKRIPGFLENPGIL